MAGIGNELLISQIRESSNELLMLESSVRMITESNEMRLETESFGVTDCKGYSVRDSCLHHGKMSLKALTFSCIWF